MAEETNHKKPEVLEERQKPKKENEKAYYPPETAGRLMTGKIPVVAPEAVIADIETALIKDAKNFESINYIYAVDSRGKLKGVLSIREVFYQPKSRVVSEIMATDLVKARTHTDQEHVALAALRKGIKSVPVVDKEDKLLGTVSADNILNILNTEAIEDALRSAGVHLFDEPRAIVGAPAGMYFRKRVPWLLLGLGGGFLAAFVVGFFEHTLQTQVVLAAFMPLVVYLGDAVGNQTQTIFIRSLALQKNLELKSYIARETKVGLWLALTLGLTVIAALAIFWRLPLVGVAVGIAVFSIVLVSMAVAMILPWFFSKIKLDPAIASGPFATIIRDIVNLLIYFGVASVILIK